jgi:hypothetical protein
MRMYLVCLKGGERSERPVIWVDGHGDGRPRADCNDRLWHYCTRSMDEARGSQMGRQGGDAGDALQMLPP